MYGHHVDLFYVSDEASEASGLDLPSVDCENGGMRTSYYNLLLYICAFHGGEPLRNEF